MLLILGPDTVQNRAALHLRRLGEQRLGRGLRVVPRGGVRSALFWRVLLDQAPLRYLIALSPFPLAMVIWPHLALPISQAPLLMFALVYLVESRLLTFGTPELRKGSLDPDEADRRLDLLRLRARDVLTRLAAGRRMQDGVLHLVVEQSGLRRVPVLTLVSVQVEGDGRPEILALSPAEQTMLADRLFNQGLDEAALHAVNLYQDRFLRDLPLAAASLSAHARLMAMAI